jgi:hypothetical protein
VRRSIIVSHAGGRSGSALPNLPFSGSIEVHSGHICRSQNNFANMVGRHLDIRKVQVWASCLKALFNRTHSVLNSSLISSGSMDSSLPNIAKTQEERAEFIPIFNFQMLQCQSCRTAVGAGKPKKSVLTQQCHGSCEKEKIPANSRTGKPKAVPAPYGARVIYKFQSL